MLANTLTVTVNAVPKVLVRVNQDRYSSEYSLKESLASWTLKIQHQKSTAKRKSPIAATTPQYESTVPVDRIRVYLEQTVYATATTPQFTYTASQSFPYVDGQSTADTKHLVIGLGALCASAFVDQLIQGEA